MKLKEVWEIIYRAEKAEREKLEEELKAKWANVPLSAPPFAFLYACARLCAWDKAHPGFVHYRAVIQ